MLSPAVYMYKLSAIIHHILVRKRYAEGHHRDFLTVGSMGHASMIALGIAKQTPQKQVG